MKKVIRLRNIVLLTLWCCLLGGLCSVSAADRATPQDQYDQYDKFESEEPVQKGIAFCESQVWFAPDSGTLDTDPAISESLKLACAYLQSEPESKLLVVGTCAAVGEQDSAVTFSLARAQAVKEYIVKKTGCESKNITCIGLGFQNSLHVNEYREGVWVRERAQQNRRALVLRLESERAELLLREACRSCEKETGDL